MGIGEEGEEVLEVCVGGDEESCWVGEAEEFVTGDSKRVVKRGIVEGGGEYVCLIGVGEVSPEEGSVYMDIVRDILEE